MSHSNVEILNYIVRVLTDRRGDDLERVRHAFHGLSDVEMEQEHEQSGKTRTQILHECEAQRHLHNEAVSFVNKLIVRGGT